MAERFKLSVSNESSHFSGIEKMGNRSSVTGTVFSKVRGFSMVSGDKNADQDAHKMIYHPVRIKFAHI